MNSKKIISECLKDNTEAWNLLYKNYYKFVLKCVKYKLKSSSVIPRSFSAKDITHDIFHSIWSKKQLESIDSPQYLKTWLSIYSINFTKNYLRKHYYKKDLLNISFESPLIDKNDFSSLAELLPDEKSDIIQTIDFNSLYNLVLKSFNALPRKQRIAIKLNILFGKKHIDISRIMNLPLPSVSSLILRAKIKTREKIFFYLKNEKK